MAEPRLKTALWVQMVLRLADQAGRPGAVLRRGDADSGGVLLVLRRGNGLMVLSQMRTGEGRLAWLRTTGEAPVDQETVDAYIARRLHTDPDLWVVELETTDFTPPIAVDLA